MAETGESDCGQGHETALQKPVGPITYSQSSGADVWPTLGRRPSGTNGLRPRPDFGESKGADAKIQESNRHKEPCG
jgi:hypothetical protein